MNRPFVIPALAGRRRLKAGLQVMAYFPGNGLRAGSTGALSRTGARLRRKNRPWLQSSKME